MDQTRREKLTYACILALAVCVYMAKPWDSSLQAMDSAIHARYALEVTRGGGWLPVLPIRKFFPDNPEPYFNDHPFLAFYWVGHFMRAFGANAWGARFLPSLFGVMNVGLLLTLARKLSGYRASIFAGIAFLISPLTIQFTARFQLDPFLVFFVLLSFLFAYDRKFFWAGVASGLAVCFKSPVGWLILPSIFIFERFRLGFWKALVPAILLPLALWLSADALSGQPLMHDYWSRQVFGTAVGGRNLSQSSDWHTGFLVLKKNFLLPILLAGSCLALEFIRRKRFGFERLKTDRAKLTLAGFLIFWFVISMMRFKFAHYYLPGIPLGILVLSLFFEDVIFRITPLIERVLWMAAPAVAIALLILPIQTAPESFPAFKFFAAIIQSEGQENDQILFVENKEPYGTAGDYFVESAFYTGKLFNSAHCDEANAKALRIQPAWIITSGSTPFECLNFVDQTHYPSIYRFGNQYLLSRTMRPDPKIMDFTVQVRALKAPIDGKAAPLPVDIFYRY